MRRRKSKQKIQFSSRSHPAEGVTSLIVGAISLVFLLFLCIFSWSERGQAGLWVGFVGILVLFLSIFGFVLAIKGYRKEDIYMITPITGAVSNGVILVVMMLLYVFGAVS
ncbi:MAG: DUF6142 family protein [Eubacterium sp.]|nr:DUF6142 family protein [Eubacterium sp.]